MTDQNPRTKEDQEIAGIMQSHLRRIVPVEETPLIIESRITYEQATESIKRHREHFCDSEKLELLGIISYQIDELSKLKGYKEQ